MILIWIISKERTLDSYNFQTPRLSAKKIRTDEKFLGDKNIPTSTV